MRGSNIDVRWRRASYTLLVDGSLLAVSHAQFELIHEFSGAVWRDEKWRSLLEIDDDQLVHSGNVHAELLFRTKQLPEGSSEAAGSESKASSVLFVDLTARHQLPLLHFLEGYLAIAKIPYDS